MKFDDTETEEYKFYRHNSPISIYEIDINEIAVKKQYYLVSFLLVNKILNISLVTKMIKEIRPLCILFLKMSTYRSFDRNDFIYQ